MGTTIGMDDWSLHAISDRFDNSIQHSIHKIGIGVCAQTPADHQAIEAVNHG